MKTIYSKQRKKFPTPIRTRLLKFLNLSSNYCGLNLKENHIISVSYVGPRKIAQINRDFLHHEGVTDVISFNYLDDQNMDLLDNEENIVIEIFVCLDVALREGSQRKDSSYADEVVLYTVHGLLHAAGEDDLTPEARKRMRQQERSVINKLRKQFNFQELFPEP